MENDQETVCWLSAAQLRLMADLADHSQISAALIKAAEIYEQESRKVAAE